MHSTTPQPHSARRTARKLKKAVQELVQTPQIGRPVSGLPGEIRELVFGSYIVRYEVRKDALYVLRVWHVREER